MIVVDASALLAILLDEPEADSFRRVLEAQGGVMSAVNFWEVLARIHRHIGRPGVAEAEIVMEGLRIDVASADAAAARAACEAFARYGKGEGGPLNLGDCFAYALAQAQGGGLLHKGDDFGQTDVTPALA